MRPANAKVHVTAPGGTSDAPPTVGPDFEQRGFDRAKVVRLDTYVSDAKVAQDPTANNPNFGNLRIAN